MLIRQAGQAYFYPRPPRGGRQLCLLITVLIISISIHALREEGDVAHGLAYLLNQSISIHALREEGDAYKLRQWPGFPNFYPRPPRGGRRYALRDDLTGDKISIHALREEGDMTEQQAREWMERFLSTPSARRATGILFWRFYDSRHFYPRPPRGGRPFVIALRKFSIYFYPRPPRGGRRRTPTSDSCWRTFLSTPSARRATKELRLPARTAQISIHALREEGDRGLAGACSKSQISIHALREEGDPITPEEHKAKRRFLSTPSARRATCLLVGAEIPGVISIHALREEGDRSSCARLTRSFRFLSTPSARRATAKLKRRMTIKEIFLSTPSARRATARDLDKARRISISIHALREEGDGMGHVVIAAAE